MIPADRVYQTWREAGTKYVIAPEEIPKPQHPSRVVTNLCFRAALMDRYHLMRNFVEAGWSDSY